ncbi:glycoside hydrolase family 38 protein [Piedraia hortae CBS 480.64]|uniref:Alpha-mannosidase n=1 Tax=Piedraia hortae CBS 480.64 TaxID=1314780 RepID=A0A6A7BQS3_9PEZI|nr:glycoside hydrolase family 38 protein [Piedraia hortae CBS 480.64]
MGGDSRQIIAPADAPKYAKIAEHPKGKLHPKIYLDRLRQFTDNGQYRDQGLLAKLYDGRVSGDPYVKLSVWSAPDQTRPTFEEATKKENKYKDTKKGDSFGPSWTTHWFKVQFKLPSDWNDKPLVEFQWDSRSEGMVWTRDGKPLQGLSGNGERTEWVLLGDYRDANKEHTIYIEMACNGMFGNAPGGDSVQPPDPNRMFPLVEADIVSVNTEARALYYDFWIIGDAAREFPSDSWQQHKALVVCNQIMDKFIAGNGSNDSIVSCRQIAKTYLGPDIDSAKVFEGNDEDAIVYSLGNCHIDTCWLWPFDETKRKIARSWSSQCDLLDRYPEYRFVASQAQQFFWLEQLYPHAWDRVKEHVKKGNFQPIGGSWVEHDTNLPSGESLVRQFLYGQRFFQSRFGQRCKTFWLPDTFGYSSQLPQLCRLAGMNRFLTQKLSWSNFSSGFPHSTFNWVGLDRSQVICHMPPCNTYTAEAHFGDVNRSVTQHKSMDQDNTSILPYGKGDGGGGPTFSHLEKLRRCRGLSNTVGLLPKAKMGVSAEDFFDRLEDMVASGKTKLVTWYGELYLELHRGTYTTQANNKRGNRKSEILLHDIEYLATLATIKDSKYIYPKKELDMMWQNVLLCQFHDCLPGSSIEMCYRDSDKIYAKVFETGQKLIKDAHDALGFHENSTSRDAVVPVQTLGWERPTSLRGKATIQHKGAGIYMLENEDLKVKVRNGLISSIWDVKAKREVVPMGESANQLVIFDDKPLYWQAWDVEVYHLDSRKELKATEKSWIVENKPERVAVATIIPISDKSWVKTTLSLNAASRDRPSWVEVEAEVEWQETMKFLKVEFPTTIANTEASYETQFGIIRRPTHYNTDWDMAKFEVCSHKWADLSEYGYGVSILNDSKYGFATAGGVMRLSLLRAPKAPDAHADMGRHKMKWAIMPHAGPLDEHTVRAGFEFNNPMRWQKHSKPEEIVKLMSAFKLAPGSSPGLVVDTVKRGEDDEDVSNGDLLPKKGRHVILRVYDSLGGFGRGTILFGPVKVMAVWKCNLLEDAGEQIRQSEEGFDIELQAFEVASYKLLLE